MWYLLFSKFIACVYCILLCKACLVTSVLSVDLERGVTPAHANSQFQSLYYLMQLPWVDVALSPKIECPASFPLVILTWEWMKGCSLHLVGRAELLNPGFLWINKNTEAKV